MMSEGAKMLIAVIRNNEYTVSFMQNVSYCILYDHAHREIKIDHEHLHHCKVSFSSAF